MLLGRSDAWSQASVDRTVRVIEAHIDFKGQEFSGDYFIINYSLPFSGMVEFRLFDNEGNKLWQNYYPNEVGDNKIVLRASKLKPGMTYAYQIVYKKDVFMQNIEMPSAGTE